MGVRGNLLEVSSAMPLEQGWLMRLDVSREMLTGNICQCATVDGVWWSECGFGGHCIAKGGRWHSERNDGALFRLR
jgi:hypothetical protein